MNDVFVDTSGWANLLVKTEPFHRQTFAILHAAQRERRRVVTSNYILAELSALLISPIRLARDIRLAALDRIRAQDWFKITHIDSEADAESWQYMQSRRDKDYSVVDCSSFVLMQRHGLNHALTSDRHFEQAGFVRLLK